MKTDLMTEHETDQTPRPQPKNPLHGITLETVVTTLVAKLGWEEMNKQIPLQCFFNKPSIKSSLIFLRKNQWARSEVEKLFLTEQQKS